MRTTRITKAQVAESQRCPADGGVHEPLTVLQDSNATQPCHIVTTRYSQIKACHHAIECQKCHRILAWSIPGDQCPDLKNGGTP